jgi:hypothetical protein
VVRIFAAPDGPEQIYETVGWLGRVPWFLGEDERLSCRFQRGKTRGFYSANTEITVMSVDGPYYTQRVRSRRLPFIIDGNGTFRQARSGAAHEPEAGEYAI